MSIRVVLADDHPVVFEGLCKNCGDNLSIQKQIRDLDDLESAIDPNINVLVTEVRVNGQDALKTVEKTKEYRPDLKIVVYSGSTNPVFVARASSIGCDDFVLKSEPVERLFQSIELVCRGVVPPDSLLTDTRNKMRRPRRAQENDIPLTNREVQVLRHVAMGLSNREIGKSLGISVETVKEHVQNILRKLDVNDRTQAAVWAVKRGLA